MRTINNEYWVLLEISDSDHVDIDSFVDACLKMKGVATGLDMQYLMFETGVIHKKIIALEAGMPKAQGHPKSNKPVKVGSSFV